MSAYPELLQRMNRIALIGLSVLLFAAALGGAHLVDSGLTRAWPNGAQIAWGLGLLGSALGGVFLLVVGLGVVSDETLASRYAGEQRSLRTGHFFAVYVGMLVVGVGGAVVAERWYGLPSERGILLTCGGVFLLAAMGRPWWLYAAIRRLGWFAAITNDIAMRLLLAVIGAGLIAGALLARAS